MTPPNQRRHKRYDTQDVHGKLAYNLDARVLNISLTGMAIETSTLLKVGEDYSLKIPRPEGPLKVQADVKWCHLVRTERTDSGDVVSVYQAGIDFRSILDDKARQMLQFIEENVVVDLEKRLFGRFHLDDGDRSVDLDKDEEFRVRKISLSGMLIETELRPTPEAVYDIELRFNGSKIDTRVRIAHVREHKTGEGLAEVGVEFQELADDARAELEHFIEGLLE